ncbi:MAG: leucine-rich repeat domain-containing protein, partial [Bacteroidaceae bacterium]|nr:leucine-rich repeat domain-containing protein [Bacteroidaceae bacterium]
MKKRVLFLICTFCAITAYGYDFMHGELYYNITSSTNRTVEVTYGKNTYTGYTYVIPEWVSYGEFKYYVTGIGSSAFSGDTWLETIEFDDNTRVQSIGNNAFSGCNGLKRITIPASVTSIGNYAFSGCFNLHTVTIKDSNTTLSLGYGSMNGSNYGLFADAGLENFYWGRPLSYNTDYGRSPIANQPLLKNITIGPNVSTITAYMFYGNTAISTITIPETVTTLGNHAFDSFTGLTSFNIPKHITSIGEYAFAHCTGLKSFSIPEWITTIDAGWFSGCNGLTSITFPGTLNSVGNYAFAGCTGIKTLTFEKASVDRTPLTLGYGSLNGIEYGLFYDCPLESVDIQRELSYQSSYP